MSRVLAVVAAIFFLGGLALLVGYAAHQTVQWRMHGNWTLAHVEYFYLGGIAASIGMITLALLEIREAILITLDHRAASEEQSSSVDPPHRSRAKRSWKKSADIQRSFLDTRDTP